MSNFSAISAIINDATADLTLDTAGQEPVQPPAPDPTPDPAVDPTPSADPATPPGEGAPPAAEDAPEIDELLEPLPDVPEADAKDLGIDLNAPRGKQLWRDHQLVKALQKPVEEGGLGHLPTVEDLQNYYKSHLWGEQLFADFTADDPSLFVDALQRMDANAFVRVATVLPERIVQQNPDAYQRIADHVMQRQEQTLLKEAQTKSYSKEYRDQMFANASFIHSWRTNGKGRLDPALMEQEPSDATVNPTNSEREELERYKQEKNQAIFNTHRTNVSTGVERALDGIATEALKPIKDKVTSVAYDAMKADLIKGAKQAIMSNEGVVNSMKAKKQMAIQNLQSAQTLQQIEQDIVRLWRSHSTTWMAANRKKYIAPHWKAAKVAPVAAPKADSAPPPPGVRAPGVAPVAPVQGTGKLDKRGLQKEFASMLLS